MPASMRLRPSPSQTSANSSAVSSSTSPWPLQRGHVTMPGVASSKPWYSMQLFVLRPRRRSGPGRSPSLRRGGPRRRHRPRQRRRDLGRARGRRVRGPDRVVGLELIFELGGRNGSVSGQELAVLGPDFCVVDAESGHGLVGDEEWKIGRRAAMIIWPIVPLSPGQLHRRRRSRRAARARRPRRPARLQNDTETHVESAVHLVVHDTALRLDETKDGWHVPGRAVDAGAPRPVGQDARDVAGDAAAGDVGDAPQCGGGQGLGRCR